MKNIWLLAFTLFSCQSSNSSETSEVVVFSLHDEEGIQSVNDLKLDDKYPNLLDPRVSTEEQLPEVVDSWSKFHQQIGNKLKEKGFEWESEEPVKLVNKIYFNSNSEVEFYAFRIMNDLPKEKIESFNRHIQEILPTVNMDLVRTGQFAQCGKVEYQN